ncbi:MAG: DUF115 domain-containing protein [Spirochaetaceae bacterium]|nr:DUF115 domain-containing protein [Spirochaetaceae bacterium]
MQTNETLPRLAQAGRGFSVFYRGKTLLSRVDPVKQTERAALAALPLAENTLYLLPSPLLGYGIPLILQNMPESSCLLCVEADAALAALSREHIAEAASCSNGRFRLVHTENPSAVVLFVSRTWGLRRFRRIAELRLTGGRQLNAAFYDAAADILRQNLVTEWSNAMTLVKLGRLYIRNAIRNLGLLAECPGAESLDFGNAPMLALGAGPSLDGFLDGFERMPPETCRIICVDTALRPLKERGIKPNLVVALEAQHWNLRDFAGMDGWKIPVAMDMSSLPAVSGLLGHETYLFWTRWTELSLFDRLLALELLPVELPPLGSVGLSAVSLALRLGSGPVFTAGMDFSFTIDSCHCRGSPPHGEILRRHTRFGGLYPTEAAFSPKNTATPTGDGVLLSTPAMTRYSSLFDDEFAGSGRVFAIEGGLPLAVPTLSREAAFREMRRAAAKAAAPAPARAAGGRGPEKAALLRSFIEGERKTLEEILIILKGGGKADRLESLLDSADYLWAHFPDCAGAGGARPSANDLGFLKRVRAEAGSFIKTWDMALSKLDLYPGNSIFNTDRPSRHT